MHKKLITGLLAAILLATFITPGCFLFDSAVDEAIDNSHDEMANNMAAGMMVPMYKSYGLSLMAAYFWAGGYWLAHHPYQPGQWTKWSHQIEQASKSEGPEQPLHVEKAFLKRNADGSEWWRLKALGKGPDETFVFEALFSAERTQIVRMLAKMGDNPVTEITFEEGEASFPAPSAFEDTWINDHTQGTVSLAAGTLSFSANHVQFKTPDGAGQVDFYFSADVPGGLIKYQFSNTQGDKYSIQLSGHGSNAVSELGAF
ncbi:MAG: hypothetical protein JRJ87_22795 [Deltaproteobacteria bacterium]|nr:hypothetical protein [Deltaproteobacteria bacterium]